MKKSYNPILRNGELNPLEKKEVQVIQLLCDGNNIESVAKSLFKSKDTINNYIRLAKTKLNAGSRDQLIAMAVKKELVDVTF